MFRPLLDGTFLFCAMVWDKTGNDLGILVLFVIIFISYIYFNIVADVRRLHDIGAVSYTHLCSARSSSVTRRK